jgi:hypothetical protein
VVQILIDAACRKFVPGPKRRRMSGVIIDLIEFSEGFPAEMLQVKAT